MTFERGGRTTLMIADPASRTSLQAASESDRNTAILYGIREEVAGSDSLTVAVRNCHDYAESVLVPIQSGRGYGS